MNSMNEYMSVNEASEFMGVTPRAVRKWIKEGKIEAFKVGGYSVRIKRSFIENFVKKVPSKVSVEKKDNVVFEDASKDTETKL